MISTKIKYIANELNKFADECDIVFNDILLQIDTNYTLIDNDCVLFNVNTIQKTITILGKFENIEIPKNNIIKFYDVNSFGILITFYKKIIF